jgi:hypothetical protein
MKIWQMFHESWLFKPAVGAVAVFFLIIRAESVRVRVGERRTEGISDGLQW